MLGFMSPLKIPMMGDVQYSNMLQNMCNNTFTQDNYYIKIIIKSRFINLISLPWDIANYIVPHIQLKNVITIYIIQ
jgi:hypothetical protein